MKKRSSFKVAGIGIDLVDLARVKKFLARHSQSQIKSLLCGREKSGRMTALKFAKLFSAKEAFFKTLNQPWFGPEGFSKLNVSFLSSNRFRVKIADGPLKKLGACEAEGSFFSEGNLVGAQVVRWEK